MVNINEVIQLFLPHIIITRYAHDVARILLAQVCIQIDQEASHGFCLFNISTKNYCLGHSADLLEHLGDTLCYNFPTFRESDVSAYVLALIQPLGYLSAQQVFLIVIRLESLKVNAYITVGHSIRSEETILYSLQERIGKYWLTEIIKIIGSCLSLGRSGHADLSGRVEILQDLAPCTVIFRTPTMAFIDNDKVKEGWLDLFEWIFNAFFIGHQLMIQCHVHLIGRINGCSLYFSHDFLERFEVLYHRLVYQNVTVGKI